MPVAFRPVMVTSFTRLEPRVEIESGEATFRIVLLASITSSSEPPVLSHPPGCSLLPLSIFVRLEHRSGCNPGPEKRQCLIISRPAGPMSRTPLQDDLTLHADISTFS